MTFKDKYIKYKQKYLTLKNKLNDGNDGNSTQHHLSRNEYDAHHHQPMLPVRDPWLYYIQTGIKTVEGRTGNKHKFDNWLGKTVIFFNKLRKIPVQVTHINHYKNLHDYLDVEGYQKCLPEIGSYENAVNEYHKFYSDEQIEKAGGMLAIHIKLI